MRIHRDRGVRINNPHTFIVEDGKAGGDLPPEVVALKRRFDPQGLLNPGKLRDWPVGRHEHRPADGALRRGPARGRLRVLSGVVAVDPARRTVLVRTTTSRAHARARALGYATGQLTVDVFEAPIVVQSWFVLDRIRQIAVEHGGTMDDVVKLVQYFRDLRHYPAYNRVRGLFYPGEPPVSTVVEVARFLPGDAALVEVEATIYLPSS